MSTCQLLSGRSKAAQTTSAGSRLSAMKLAIRRAGASSAVRRATKVGLSLPDLFCALVTAVYARGRGELPQELSTGYRQPVDACSRAEPGHLHKPSTRRHRHKAMHGHR